MPRRVQEKIDFLDLQISSVRGWLSTFGKGAAKARPDHEIEIKQDKLEMFKEIRDDYQQSLDRANR